MLRLFKDIANAVWDDRTNESKQINDDINTLSSLLKKHFDLNASSYKPYINIRDAEARGGVPIYLHNDERNNDVFKDKLEQAKHVVQAILPNKYFDTLRSEIDGTIHAAFTLKIDELSLLNNQLEHHFNPRPVTLAK